MQELKFEKLKIEYEGKECFIKIQRVGQEHCASQKAVEVRNCTYYSFHLITHGLGYVQNGDDMVCLGKGNVFILWPGVECKYYPMEVDPWSYIWIDFYGDGVEELLNACGLSKEKTVLKKVDFATICEIMKQLYERYNGSEVQDLFCYANLMLLFGNLISYEKRYTSSGENKNLQFKQFRDALIYINNNFRMNPTLCQIADEMYLTQKQLIAMFKANIGITPIEYMNRFRISLACDMLITKDYKIQEIAKIVGIEDEKYFMRLFRKITGMSASEYRKNCKDDDPFLWLKEKSLDLR